MLQRIRQNSNHREELSSQRCQVNDTEQFIFETYQFEKRLEVVLGIFQNEYSLQYFHNFLQEFGTTYISYYRFLVESQCLENCDTGDIFCENVQRIYNIFISSSSQSTDSIMLSNYYRDKLETYFEKKEGTNCIVSNVDTKELFSILQSVRIEVLRGFSTHVLSKFWVSRHFKSWYAIAYVP